MRSQCMGLFLVVSAVALLELAVGAPANGSTPVICTFNGTQYSDGEQIRIPNDVCLHCECRQGWTGPSETECARIDCPYWMLGFTPDRCPMETKPGECCPDSPCLRKLEAEQNDQSDLITGRLRDGYLLRLEPNEPNLCLGQENCLVQNDLFALTLKPCIRVRVLESYPEVK